MNNESLGITTEFIICELAGLPSEHLRARIHTPLIPVIRPVIERALRELPLVISHEGGSSDVDFHTEAGTLSVKTNQSIRSAKVAPQRCGQPSARTFSLFFREFFVESELVAGVVPREIMKQRVQARIHEFIPIYLANLLDCDHTLWLWAEPHPSYRIIDRGEAGNIHWELKRFSFTVDPYEWNESCTVKYLPPGAITPLSIGEFQIHNNRDNYKFRFIMKNLLIVVDGEKQ